MRGSSCGPLRRANRLLSLAPLAVCAAVPGTLWGVTGLSVVPDLFRVDAPTNSVLTADTVSPGNTLVIEVFVDADGDTVVDPEDWLRVRYEIVDGAARVCPSVVGDDDGVADGSVACELPLHTGPLVVGRYVVRVTDEDASTAAAALGVERQPTAQWVTGRVVDGDGLPVAGAIGTAQNPGETDVAYAITDAAGTFTVHLADTGVYYVAGLLPGHVTLLDGGMEVVDVASGANATPADLVVRAGSPTISGTVRTAAPDKPVPGVMLFFEGEGEEGDGLALAITDGAGAFATTVAPGTWSFGVGGSDAQALGLLFTGEERVAEVDTNGVTGVELELEPVTACIQGQVVNTDGGQPVAGIGVEAWSEAGWTEWTTDPQGAFAVGVRGGAWGLGASAEQLAAHLLVPLADAEVTLPAGGSATGVVLEAEPGRWIRGSIAEVGTLDPIEGVELATINTTTLNWRQHDVESDADGLYELLVARSADHWVRAAGRPPDYLYQYYDGVFRRSAATAIAAGTSTVSGVNFLLVPPAVVQGTVREAGTGVPLGDAVVLAFEAGSGEWLDGVGAEPDGSYSLYVPTTEVLIQAISDGYADQFWDHALGMDDATPLDMGATGTVAGVNFDLVEPGWIEGTVVGDGGPPLAGVSISAHAHPDGAQVGGTTSAGDGRFSLKVPPGNRAVWFHGPTGFIGEWYDDHPDYETDGSGADALVVVAGATNDLGTVSLAAGAVIAGTVSAGFPPVPLADAEVRVQATSMPQPGGGAWTAADGTYEVTIPTNRSYYVWALADGYARVIYDDTMDWGAATLVEPEGTNRADGIDFVLPEGNWVYGTVRAFETGLPMEGAWVVATLIAEGSDSPTTWTRPDGTYDFSLASGAYRIESGKFGYLPVSYDGAYLESDAQPVEVTSAQGAADVDLMLVPAEGDSDGDGLANDWEAREGTDPTQPDADEDPDGDLASNEHERDAGTRPRDRESVFVVQIEPGEPQRAVVRYSVVEDRTYRVFSAPAPGGPWQERHSATAVADGWAEWADPTAASTGRRFYKVSVDVP